VVAPLDWMSGSRAAAATINSAAVSSSGRPGECKPCAALVCRWLRGPLDILEPLRRPQPGAARPGVAADLPRAGPAGALDGEAQCGKMTADADRCPGRANTVAALALEELLDDAVFQGMVGDDD